MFMEEILSVDKVRLAYEDLLWYVFVIAVMTLDGSGIESRWGAIFSAPLQADPVTHPVCYTIGSGSLSRG
jgi:hypothetical protein